MSNTAWDRVSFKAVVIERVLAGDAMGVAALMGASVDGVPVHSDAPTASSLVGGIVEALDKMDFPEHIFRALLGFKGPEPEAGHFTFATFSLPMCTQLVQLRFVQSVKMHMNQFRWSAIVKQFPQRWEASATVLAHALSREKGRWTPLRSAWIASAVVTCIKQSKVHNSP